MKQHWRPWAALALLALLGGVGTLHHRTVYSGPADGPTRGPIVQAASYPVPDVGERLAHHPILDSCSHHRQAATPQATPHDPVRDGARQDPVVKAVPVQTSGPALFQTTTLTIPTYPYVAYLTPVYTPTYNITYRRLNWDAYNTSHPTPVPQEYELLVLENDYLRVTLLPELGGRVYQMIFKPTGHNELYQNPVVKPNEWGAPEQKWWLAVGGFEWCLPVEEHGYEWCEPWDYQVITSTAGVTVTLRDTPATDRIRAAVTVHLPTGRGYLAITPRVENPTGHSIEYKYWTNAMLAPGATNTVSADLHFVLNAEEMAVHSTSDDRLPGHDATLTGPDHRFSWPVYHGTDFSRLGNWHGWLGFFEYPQAAADFAGIYDSAANEGVARIFPSSVVLGSKGFAFGWSNPLDWRFWTDDSSTYVELHGGVAPTFWDAATITAGQSLEWTEYWYPVSGIGQLTTATGDAALGVRESDGRFIVGVHATAPHAAGESALHIWDRNDCSELDRWELPDVEPGNPFVASVATGGRTLNDVALVYLDAAGDLLAAVNPRDCLPPTSSIEPLPTRVPTTSFTVTWAGRDAWTEIDTYDVQVRDGYEGTWTDWLTDTTTISSVFTGTHGHTYFFRVRARDLHGNQKPYTDEEWGQTFTTVLTEPAPVLVTSRKLATPRRFRPDQTIAYTVLISNTGNLTAAAMLTDTPPLGMAVLTKTLMASASATPVYDGDAIHWTGEVAPGSEVRITYALSPTAATLLGLPLTNAAEIAGSVHGPFTRQKTITLHPHVAWLPLLARGR